MPKTRLTAKLCSTPTVKSPSSDGSPSTSSPSSVPVTPVTPTGAPPPAVPKSPLNYSAATVVSATTAEPLALRTTTTIPTCASSIDYVLHKDACDSESDLDDDLPDALSTNEVSTSLPVKGDAVWVKYRSHNFWPCLVLHSNPKTKKLHIVFLDDLPVNGQNTGEKVYLKYNKQKVVPYNHENKSKFEAEGKNLECQEMRKKFQAALNKMVDYLTKRALGLKAACKVFLNEPVSSEDESSTKPNASPPPQPPSQQPEETHSYPTKRKRKREERENEEKEKDSSGESVSSDSKSNRRRKVMTPAERRAMRKEKNQPIVDFICSKEMKSHLTKVYRGQTPSERHQLYMQGFSRKIQTNSTGPIDDDEQLDRILNHIGNWHQELTQQKMPNMDYLLWIWLPEAIIYALKKVRHCGEKKAKEIFEKGIRLTKSEHLEIHNQLLKAW